MKTQGRIPPAARPAAMVSMWLSAMPTSKNRSGKRARKRSSLTPVDMAAVKQTTRGSASAIASVASDAASLQLRRLGPLALERGDIWWYFVGSASAGAEERAERELAEAEILLSYLPAQMSDADLD